MARGFGALLVITTVSEIAASRSDFEEQDFTVSYRRPTPYRSSTPAPNLHPAPTP
jgi:hypothetical protein